MMFIPLCALLGFQLLLVALLVVPVQTARRIAMPIVGVLKGSTGKHVVGTLCGLLIVLLASDIVSIWGYEEQLSNIHATTNMAGSYEQQSLFRLRLEAFMIGACLVCAVVISSLHTLTRGIDKLRLEKEMLLKQSRNVQAEFNRLHLVQGELSAKEVPGAPTELKADLQSLRDKLLDLEKDNEALKEATETKSKEAKEAKASLSALKKQAENQMVEFDRLYDENEGLRAQLAAFDTKYSRSEGKKKT